MSLHDNIPKIMFSLYYFFNTYPYFFKGRINFLFHIPKQNNFQKMSKYKN